jgi:hypothetical protein
MHDLEPALCLVPSARETGIATFEFQKLVESGTSRLRNVFRIGIGGAEKGLPLVFETLWSVDR